MSKKPIFEIKRISLVALTKFNIKGTEYCTICKNNLNSNSLCNEEKGKNSRVINGFCSHSFHEECILPWVKKNKTCPICRKPWKEIKCIESEFIQEDAINNLEV